MTELTILPELRDLLDLPSDQERKILTDDLIKSGGPRDALVVWKDGEREVLVDGHNRHAICSANALPFRVEYKQFADLEAVKEWVMMNQLGRRNLTPQRFSYFMGLLYNKSKQDPEKVRTATVDKKTTAEALSEQFGVSERTVRRAGDEAKGIDVVAAVHGIKSVKDKLALIKEKSYTKDDLAELGTVKDPEIAKVAVKEIEKIKEVAKQDKQVTQATTKPTKAKAEGSKTKAAAAPELYNVVFMKPEFDAALFNVNTVAKPPLAENSVLYMVVPDEAVGLAFFLLNKWQYNYEGMYVYTGVDGYEGTIADVRHTFLLAATRGTVVWPEKVGQSVVKVTQDKTIDEVMIKMIEGYHPKGKRLDLRKTLTATGWDAAKAA